MALSKTGTLYFNKLTQSIPPGVWLLGLSNLMGYDLFVEIPKAFSFGVSESATRELKLNLRPKNLFQSYEVEIFPFFPCFCLKLFSNLNCLVIASYIFR